MAVFCYTAELDLSSLHMHLYGWFKPETDPTLLCAVWSR